MTENRKERSDKVLYLKHSIRFSQLGCCLTLQVESLRGQLRHVPFTLCECLIQGEHQDIEEDDNLILASYLLEGRGQRFEV